MMRPSMPRLAALALLLAGCGNAGESLTYPPLPDGGIAVGVYLDRDGSGTLTSLDTTMTGVRIFLLPAGGVDTIRSVATIENGVAAFVPAPLGRYRILVDRGSLGDSIGVVVGDTGTIEISARPGGATATRQVRLGYAEATVAEARALPPGRRVMVRGIVTSPLQAFRDSTMFLRDGTGSLRITSARHLPGRVGNNIGDSVAVLGTTGTSFGQPVLVGGRVSSLGQGITVTPEAVTVAELRTARGGALDAAFVLLTGAKLADTATVAPDFRITVLDPADSASRAAVLFDSLLLAPPAIFVEGRTVTVRGMLVPRGDGTWLLKPRTAPDLTLGN